MIWVAEIGSAHNGSKAQAFEMIRQAKLAGATIAKFQFWTTDAQYKYVYNADELLGCAPKITYLKDEAEMFEIRNSAMDWAEDLVAWCNHFDIEFMASIWSQEGLEVARKVGMKRYKIAHQMTNDRLICDMLEDEKEIFSSLHFAYPRKQMRLLYCSPDYPSYPEKFSIPSPFEHYGYSSHMHGIADALIAVSRGAKYIEKHVTLNKADTSLRDNAFALDFGEFAEMVRIGNEIERLV